MTQSLHGKTALVTGSTSGIGLEIAKELLARGANVMFNGVFGNNAEARAKFNETFEALQGQYPLQQLRFSETDVTDPKAVEAMVAETAEQLGKGRIDVLVNNAGIQRQFSIENLSVEHWNAVINTNLNSVFYTTKAALPFMKRYGKGFGQIVNISSVHGQVGSPERAAYCSAKHGVEAFTKVSAMEFAEHGIRANTVDPAFVNTELALAPLVGMAEKLQEESGGALSYDEAYKKVTATRLENQGGEWLDVGVVARTVADLADFTDKRETAESIDLGLGYIQKALSNPGHGAYFDKQRPAAVAKLNEQVQALGQGQAVA